MCTIPQLQNVQSGILACGRPYVINYRACVPFDNVPPHVPRRTWVEHYSRTPRETTRMPARWPTISHFQIE